MTGPCECSKKVFNIIRKPGRSMWKFLPGSLIKGVLEFLFRLVLYRLTFTCFSTVNQLPIYIYVF